MLTEGWPQDHQSRAQVLTLLSTSEALTESPWSLPRTRRDLLPLLLAYTWISQGSQGDLGEKGSQHTPLFCFKPSGVFPPHLGSDPKALSTVTGPCGLAPPSSSHLMLCGLSPTTSTHVGFAAVPGTCPGHSSSQVFALALLLPGAPSPYSSPGWLHLVIQVCCKPLRVPPNSLFCLLSC